MRKRRVAPEGAYYHVIARVNNKENLLEYDSMKILFEKTVIREKENIHSILRISSLLEIIFIW